MCSDPWLVPLSKPCPPSPTLADTSDEEEEEEEEEGGSESEDEEAPAAVPLKGLGKKAVKPRARSLVDDEAEEASSEEDEDDDMEDEDEEESDEDLEDTEGEAGSAGLAGGALFGLRTAGQQRQSVVQRQGRPASLTYEWQPARLISPHADDSEEQQQQQKGERRKPKKAFRLIGGAPGHSGAGCLQLCNHAGLWLRRSGGRGVAMCVTRHAHSPVCSTIRQSTPCPPWPRRRR